MTDRELLEAAAKAAGLDIVWAKDLGCMVHRPYGYNPRVTWNPLTDDGDALRLAVKLELDLCHTPQTPTKIAVWCQSISDFIEEDRQPDHYAATRRAIVRAAAAMSGDREANDD